MTQTLSKPAKAARTIVSTKITADGVKTTISASAIKQIEAANGLIKLLENVPQYADEAKAAYEHVSALVHKASK